MTKHCHRGKLGLSLLISVIFLAGSACSIPSLEPSECAEARVAVKQFYSFHFANDMEPSKENLHARQQYLTPRLFNSLWAATSVAGDHFTTPSNYPKAFRVGECTVQNPEKAVFQVILLWHDDTRSEQKEIAVEMVKQADKWLVDGVMTMPKK